MIPLQVASNMCSLNSRTGIFSVGRCVRHSFVRSVGRPVRHSFVPSVGNSFVCSFIRSIVLSVGRLVTCYLPGPDKKSVTSSVTSDGRIPL